jgi:hypothetical protein
MAATAKTPPAINELKHPHFIANEMNWLKWRLTALGGTEFLRHYLVKYSKLEGDEDFAIRKKISYVAAFAKKGLNKIRNAVFKRMVDIVRSGGPRSYQDACSVKDVRGVDLQGSSMTAYLAREVLPEMLSMSKVGVYVDMPPLPGPTVADKGDRRPYLYTYRAEHIRSWAVNRNGDPSEFVAVLLEDSDYNCDDKWELLPYEMVTSYRYVWIDRETGLVNVKFYNQDYDEKGSAYWVESAPIELSIRKIPFVVFNISDSLLADAADYQIALLNLNSADLGFALKANYPVYTEQVDWRSESPHLKTATLANTQSSSWDMMSSQVTVNADQIRQIRLGAMGGRQYPANMERPGFIHPSSEPMVASMAKEEQMKREMDELITHSLSTLSPTQEAQRSTDEDDQTAGLHYIGLALETGERKLAEFWAMYDGGEPAKINYPTDYTLTTEEERQQRATFYKDMIPHIPSKTGQREVAARMVKTMLEGSSDPKDIEKAIREVKEATVIFSDPEGVKTDLEQALVTRKLASKIRGYPEGEAEGAQKEYEERLKLIAVSQSPGGGTGKLVDDGAARGTGGADPTSGKQEKTASQKNQDTEPVPHDKTRGANA